MNIKELKQFAPGLAKPTMLSGLRASWGYAEKGSSYE